MQTIYPLDFSALQKGDVVTQGQIEHILGVKATEDFQKYQIGQMNLADRIAKEMAELGQVVTVKSEGRSVRILTDAEAAHYNRHRFNLQQGDMHRSHVRNMGVDVTALPDVDRKTHLRTLEVQSKILQGMMAAGSKVIGLAYKRRTPGLPPPATE